MMLYHVFLGSDFLRDDTLYPLNELKDAYPDLYIQHLKKYQGRPEGYEQLFPPLSCGWHDVVYMCTVHPEKLFAAIATHAKLAVPPVTYYEIPVSSLDPAKLAIWFFRSWPFDPADVVPFQEGLLHTMQDVPETTVAYYRQQEQVMPLLCFMHIPHVVCRGAIDMKGCKQQHTHQYEPSK